MTEPQYVTDAKGKKIAVIIDIDDYERMMEKLEERDDVRDFDKEWPQAKQDLKKGKLKTIEEVEREIGE